MALPRTGRLLSEVAPLLAVMRPITQTLAYSDGAIEAVTRSDEHVQRLRTVPSVGRAGGLSYRPYIWVAAE